MDRRGETDGGGALACCEDGAVRCLFNVFEDLGFGGSGVAEKEDVDIAADGVLALGFFGDAAEEGEGNGCFDVGMTVDGGGDGGDDFLDDLRVARESTDVSLILLCKAETGKLVMGFDNMIGLEDGGKDWKAIAVV